MTNNPETFDQLAITIIHWWQTVALGFVLMGLLIVFFFTMHKGAAYRGGFLSLIVIGTCYIYALVVEQPTGKPSVADALLPVLFTSWIYVTWSRAVLLMRSFRRHRLALQELAEKDLSAETDWVPYLETSLFAERLERWQKWLYGVLAGAFASGILATNVGAIETLLLATIKSNLKIEYKDQQAKESRDKIAQTLEEKNIRDSLWQNYLLSKLAAQSQQTSTPRKSKSGKSKEVTRPAALIINAPSARGLPQNNFPLPSADRVKTPATTNQKQPGKFRQNNYGFIDQGWLDETDPPDFSY